MVIDIARIVDNFIMCTCSTDRFIILFVYCGQYLSLWYGHICDGIVFDIWYVAPTLGMFFGVNLGWATTLIMKIGWFLGLFTTFEILECIRVADTTEPFFVFGRNTSVFVAKTYITIWDYCNGSAMADQTTDQQKRHYNTVLL